ncbi:Homoserine/homoserine lactone efflux protein [Pseudoruegeria aquimaris]|uniref:Homoserine/homoserine lactone efflux protein n=1 Tax=Pseudoruegeria aquimaris TaxID=393663 RepID=A0A1Y5TUH5_9RHOB|nr:LysE family translocator [Pseudoruegeria aquimaris]SLN68508.1 Homoserine/homoserine lactone efflux protein [Pseudoruegeria aquimaris]
MSFEGWIVFALFWAVFVTTPGPNAVNCIQNGMQFGFRKSLWGVAAILCQATAFLLLSALGVTAVIAASPALFLVMKILGAGFLIGLGVKGWLSAGRPPQVRAVSARGIFGRALLIATINAKSVAGYLAAFSQFVQPDVPIWSQMGAIMPTALTLTALSYCGYTALGAGLGRAALGAVLNLWFRRFMAACFVTYGLLLGGTALPLGGRA